MVEKVLQINMNLVYTIINLVVLYLLLRHFLIRPVTEIMEKRKKLIEEGLKNAQSAQEDADKMKQEYTAALSGAKQESAKIIEDARRNAKAEYDRIVNEAGAQAGSIIESAKETVRLEREKTMKDLQTEIAGLAAAAAVRVISTDREEQRDRELYEQFLREAEEGSADGNR